MRSILDFYRSNPLVLLLAIAVGLALSLLVAVGGSDGIVGPIVFAVVIGVLVGLGVAWARQPPREDAGDEPD